MTIQLHQDKDQQVTGILAAANQTDHNIKQNRMKQSSFLNTTVVVVCCDLIDIGRDNRKQLITIG